METVGLPSFVLARFNSGRYSIARKDKSNLKVSVNSGIALPRLLECGLVDEIGYFCNEHLHWNYPKVWISVAFLLPVYRQQRNRLGSRIASKAAVDS